MVIDAATGRAGHGEYRAAPHVDSLTARAEPEQEGAAARAVNGARRSLAAFASYLFVFHRGIVSLGGSDHPVDFHYDEML